MHFVGRATLALSILSLALGLSVPASAGKPASKQVRLVAFVGSASKPPAMEAKVAYEKVHPNITIDMTFGGSGTLLNQMTLEELGDIYMPGSDDFMDKAEKQKAVVPSTRKIVAYLVPMICVQHGNPKGIHSLKDMARPGIKVGLAKAGAVCLGDVSDEILKKAGLEEQVKKNVITYAASCELTQRLIELGEVDAIIGWDSFKSWAPDKIDLVRIPSKLLRVRNVPAAVAVYSKNRRESEEFIRFLTSPKGKAIFAKDGYRREAAQDIAAFAFMRPLRRRPLSPRRAAPRRPRAVSAPDLALPLSYLPPSSSRGIPQDSRASLICLRQAACSSLVPAVLPSP